MLGVWGAFPIVLYSMGNQSKGFYHNLNTEMRLATKVKAAERRIIKETWQSYIRVLLTALRKLPVFEGYVYRGVTTDKEDA